MAGMEERLCIGPHSVGCFILLPGSTHPSRQTLTRQGNMGRLLGFQARLGIVSAHEAEHVCVTKASSGRPWDLGSDKVSLGTLLLGTFL